MLEANAQVVKKIYITYIYVHIILHLQCTGNQVYYECTVPTLHYILPMSYSNTKATACIDCEILEDGEI